MSSTSTRIAVLVLLACAPGCISPTVIELPGEPEPSVLDLATQQERRTGAAVRFEMSERARRLTLERNFGDPFNEYEIPVGLALETSLQRLCTDAIQGPRRSSVELGLRVAEADADCGMGEGGARATIRITLEVTLGADELERRSVQASGAVSDSELWSSFGAPVGMETAFARALRDLHVKVLRVLERLRLPAPSEVEPLPARAEPLPLAAKPAPRSAPGTSRGAVERAPTQSPVAPRRRVRPVATHASGGGPRPCSRSTCC